MKTKIYIVLLLGLFSIKSNAQEQFLKLDSIQVINGSISNFNQIYIGNNLTIHNGEDTLRISSNHNSVIKLKNVQLEIMGNGQNLFNDPVYLIKDFTLKVNQRLIMSYAELHIRGNQQDWGYAYGIKEFNITENEEVYFSLSSQNNSRNSNQIYSFNYRIELHHYSYE